MRIMAFDYGTKRVGVAVTDPLQIIASALETIPTAEIYTFTTNYISKEPVEAFVVGLPQSLDGTATDSSAQVAVFIKHLQNRFPHIPIHQVDERFTSKMAMQSMVASGVSKKDRKVKGNLDKISATIILQTYMEGKSYGR
ncbi:MAG: Holliday junction resolvase RuvX [Bacteroidota bacterium]